MSAIPAARDIDLLGRLLSQRGNLAQALLEGPGFVSAVRLRMSALGITDSGLFAARVMSDEHEFQLLASEIAVPETWFFRYLVSYEYLLKRLSDLSRTRSGALVCASLGCATGVEAWCIAAAALAAGWPPDKITVHAIDRNPIAAEAARTGRISAASVRSEFPVWAAPWISLTARGVELSPQVRACVQVRTGDLLSTPELLLPGIDVIFCRNVLIYLDAPARLVLRDRIAQWLAADGLLLLGHADALVRGDVFEPDGPPSAFALRKTRGALVASRSLRTPAVSPRSATPPQALTRGLPTPPPADHKPRAPLPSIAPAGDHAAVLRQLHALIRSGSLTQARELAESALAHAPTCVELLESLAGVLSAQNDRAGAHQIYQRVVYLEPTHGPALLALAELSAALGHPEESQRFRARLKRLIDQ